MMKKVLLVSLVLVAFAACNKDEKVKKMPEPVVIDGTHKFSNPGNPMDFVGEYVREAILFVNSTQTDSGDAFPSFEEYYANFENFFSENPLEELYLNPDAFTPEVEDEILNIVNIANSVGDLSEFMIELTQFEDIIMQGATSVGSDEEQIDILLTFASCYRYFASTWWVDGILIGELDPPKSWEEFHDDCMHEKLNSMNWVEWTAFIVGCPISFTWLVASCTHEATVNYRAHLKALQEQ